MDPNVLLLKAPFSGMIVYVSPGMAPGSELKAGEELILLERMKMQTWIEAPQRARVLKVHVREGDRVQGEQVLAELKALP